MATNMDLEIHNILEGLRIHTMAHPFHIRTNDLVFGEALPQNTYLYSSSLAYDDNVAERLAELENARLDYNETDLTVRNYYGELHSHTMFPSFPQKLNVISNDPVPVHLPNEDGTLSEFLVPLRPILDGDDPDVVAGKRPRATVKPCVLCFGHPKIANCTNYFTPASRIHRLRDINFSLHMLKLPQMCPFCLVREYGHVYSNLCEEKIWCYFCGQPAHHQSLCSSATHTHVTAFYETTDDSLENARVVSRGMMDIDVQIMNAVMAMEDQNKKNMEFDIRLLADLLEFKVLPRKEKNDNVDEYEEEDDDDDEKDEEDEENDQDEPENLAEKWLNTEESLSRSGSDVHLPLDAEDGSTGEQMDQEKATVQPSLENNEIGSNVVEHNLPQTVSDHVETTMSVVMENLPEKLLNTEESLSRSGSDAHLPLDAEDSTGGQMDQANTGTFFLVNEGCSPDAEELW